MSHDLRTAPAALACWAGAALLVTSRSLVALVVTVTAVTLAAALLRLGRARVVALAAVCLAVVAASCAWRLTTVEHSPVRDLAAEHARVVLDVEVLSDARTFTVHGRESVVVEVRLRRAVSRDRDVHVRDRATAFLDGTADDLVVGRRLVMTGRLAPSDATDEVAVIDVSRRGPADRAAWWWEASERVREGVRRSVAHLSTEPRALVPALVDGDDTRIPDEVDEDFRRAGLTHLMAVSGTNLTIVLAVVMLLAKAAGLRRRGLWLVGAVSVVAFVLLARPDPSVVRAAAMGAVGIAALGLGSRGGVRALCWAVIGLVFLDPWLSRSAGFVLSTLATAGILLLAPALAGRLERWMPRWCALTVAVPLAAQLACTPAIAALSGEVSLVAVFANLLAGPAVAPATIAGLLGGLVALVSVPLAQVTGIVAGAGASWILAVGHRAAGLEAASLQWHAPWQLLLVVVPVVTVAVAVVSTRPALFLGLCLGLLIGVWRPPQTGWPPEGWIMVACDVGQGDATVLAAGPGSAVVVDAGPDPPAVDRCLDRLGVRRVRLMVFTHAHADHVDGWPGVRAGRRVDQVAVGPTGGPSARGVPVHVVSPGETFTVGEVSAEVVWPIPDQPSSPAEGSATNDASVVLRAEVRGIRLLLTGDIEPAAQRVLLREHPDLAADVLKMPHHGSARQLPALFAAVGARIVTISAGEGNDYGHPAAAALSLLRRQGTAWWRTDTDGDIAVVQRDARQTVVTRH
ncbi:MAG: competence protein ComEC [Aeromicrobium sp.]|uniref:ComEC/Rec2 family competence protein n=1 Tax=Aeromicrobium sp. TaxID=1871063 RepID=UPI00261BF218|nr:ComEC/Rec2 family competence protein [Aeromicrobium sp.]MCW2823861.1 competence protein ComEC [Aeromicrobium sp.]